MSSAAAVRGVIPVELVGGEAVSGLADMLQQFLEQTVAESPRKARQAQQLAGCAVFRAAEDAGLSVCITFAGDRIELRGGTATDIAVPSITADFLTIAHLTAGQESPFRLLVQRRLRARFALRDVPFLFALLRFMRIEPATVVDRPRWRRWLWPVAAAGAAGALYWYVATAS